MSTLTNILQPCGIAGADAHLHVLPLEAYEATKTTRMGSPYRSTIPN